MSYPELTGGIFCSITVKQNQKKKKRTNFLKAQRNSLLIQMGRGHRHLLLSCDFILPCRNTASEILIGGTGRKKAMPRLDPLSASINPCLAGTMGYILDLTTVLINSPVIFT